MSWWEIGGIVLLLLVGWQVYVYFHGNPKFWRLVGRHPELAIKLFHIERACLINEEPPHGRRSEYVGPFFVYACGARNKLYILQSDIELLQARIAKVLYAAEGKAPHLGVH